MKKIIAAVILLALLLFNLPQPLEKVVSAADSVVTFHFHEKRDGAVFQGTTYCLSVSGNEADAVRKNYDGIAGTSVRFKAAEDDLERWLKSLSAVNVRREDTAGAIIYTARSHRLTGGVMTSNGKVNFQIAYSNGFITIGSPLIFGSF